MELNIPLGTGGILPDGLVAPVSFTLTNGFCPEHSTFNTIGITPRLPELFGRKVRFGEEFGRFLLHARRTGGADR
ncbi:MAG: hypothetical protein ACYSYM_04315, partial [Planctomycetota bacterium]